jgi:uncharacterized Zn-finger protein
MDLRMIIVEVQGNEVRCAGGDASDGHPAVFLNLGAEGKAVCPYCSKMFIHAQVSRMKDHDA